MTVRPHVHHPEVRHGLDEGLPVCHVPPKIIEQHRSRLERDHRRIGLTIDLSVDNFSCRRSIRKIGNSPSPQLSDQLVRSPRPAGTSR